MTRQRRLLAMSAVVAAGTVSLTVGDRDRVPAVCFASMSTAFLVPTVLLVVIRR